MYKRYNLIIKESSENFLSEANNIQQQVINLQNKLASLKPSTPEYQKTEAQLIQVKKQLAIWQDRQNKAAQQSAAQQAPQRSQSSNQSNDGEGLNNNAVAAVGSAATIYSAIPAAQSAYNAVKKAPKVIAKQWGKMGKYGKAGVVAGGVALAGLAAWKIKKMRCRKKCYELGSDDDIRNCVQKC